MGNQNVLIVDDSLTARLVLKRLLEQQAYKVDMVESAEQALEFLKHSQPDVIFMDHMMPGMDGFQAVKAIKANAATSDIPIVMYTSKAGDLYVGQARALGAADILTKPPARKDLNAIFQRLAANDSSAVEMLSTDESESEVSKPDTMADSADVVEQDDLYQPEPVLTQEQKGEPEESGRSRFFWLAILIVMAIVWAALWFGLSYSNSKDRNETLLKQRDLVVQTVFWALDQTLEYPSGEEPFAGERLNVLRELISRLSASGFEGKLVLEAHAGQFCSMLTADGGWITPPVDLPIYACDRVGLPAEQAVELTAGQSLEFKRFLVNSPFLQGSGLVVEVRSKGATEPLYDYPPETAVKTVGDWNRIAQRNNRVQVILNPQ